MMTINKNTKWYEYFMLNWENEEKLMAPWVRGLCGQLEKGTTGNMHWQLYIECSERITFGKLHKFFKGVHLERRMGTAQDAIAYCQKDDETFQGCRFRYGAFFIGGKGARTDLSDVKEALKTQPLEVVADNHFETFIRYHSGMTTFSNWYQPTRDQSPIDVYILIGPSGTGKSTLAKILERQWGQAYRQSGGKWWFGYRGEDYVIVDEFEGQWPYAFWKRACDRGGFTIEGKGTERQLLATKFVFTSNKSWTEWWQIPPHRLDEIKRRVRGIINVSELKHYNVGGRMTWRQKRDVEYGQDVPYPTEGEGFFWD